MAPDARARLEALGTVLRAHGMSAWFTPDGLRVENPRADGCCTVHPCAVLTVGPREADAGRLWFWTNWRHPVADADRVADAVTVLKALLSGEPGVVL
ncbi:hypothetical protein F8568_017300 [Actinomadura sp. LD22]|uniref:Uncharacterized protein n=1 Tax=Actinomadura physcomitrii TaxID=2650748 RepID=A0A6I4MDK8_9ACTN|nr:hypothetical protein [Actinomadura physcomitrii]MWA02097.1 hypothetical protein [Actinomadura physcomitrii]